MILLSSWRALNISHSFTHSFIYQVPLKKSYIVFPVLKKTYSLASRVWMYWQWKDGNIYWGVSDTWQDKLQESLRQCYSVPPVSPDVHASPVRYTGKILFFSFYTWGPEAETVKWIPKVTQVFTGGARNQTQGCGPFPLAWVLFTEYTASLGMLVGVSHPAHLAHLWICLHRTLCLSPSRTPSEKVVLWLGLIPEGWISGPCAILYSSSPCLSLCSSLWPRKPTPSPSAEILPVPRGHLVEKLLWWDSSFLQTFLAHCSPVTLRMWPWRRIPGMGDSLPPGQGQLPGEDCVSFPPESPGRFTINASRRPVSWISHLPRIDSISVSPCN